MVRYPNSYLLRLLYHKVPSFAHFFPNTHNELTLADDTSLFPIARNSNISANELNNHLQKISEWAYNRKISANPNLNKQAQEVIFSRKLNKPSHPKIVFDSAPVICADW